MKVLVIGGSGRQGKLVIEELLDRGHEVTALVRKSDSLTAFPNARIVIGTPTQKEDVDNAFKQSTPEVVIVTLSAPRAGNSPFAANISPPRLMADSNANVVAAMKRFSAKKIVIMQALGVGDSWSSMNCIMQLLMRKSNMIYQYNDHNLVDQETRASGVNYVMVRPSMLTDGEPEEVKVWPEAGKGIPMMAKCSRGSVTKFLVDAAEGSKWDGACPVISN